MEIPDEMLREIRESGYDQELVYNYIRDLLNCDKQIKESRAYRQLFIRQRSTRTFCWDTDSSRAYRQLLIR